MTGKGRVDARTQRRLDRLRDAQASVAAIEARRTADMTDADRAAWADKLYAARAELARAKVASR